jgi:hypothetical protein
MRTWLNRWRWWLVLALLLVAGMGFIARNAFTPDPLQLAFDRVEDGMSPQQVEDVMTMTGYVSSSPLRVDPTFRYNSVDYRFQSGVVIVWFDGDGRVDWKILNRWHKSFWDKFRAWLNRVRELVSP